jgi:MSHA biogenesis protein MshP
MRRDGFSLPSAIFILVVLATAGVFMTRMSGVQQRTGNLALGGVRAYWAAHAGLEWGVNRTLTLGSCQSGTFTLTEGGTGGFSVTVGCTSSQHTEEAIRTVYRLSSVATRGGFGDRDYASRTLEATVTDTP